MKKILAGIAVGLMCVPLTASALTADELKAQIGALLSQLTQLQQLIAGSATTTLSADVALPTACPSLVRVLSRGMRGDDVMLLQKFLVSQGVLSADSATGFYGALTEAAVRKWQSDRDIVSSGSALLTGWGAIGSRTRAAIRAACGGETTPTNDTLSVSVRGLDVSAELMMNAKGSCGAVSYVLDFGDSTPAQTIPVAANTCHAVTQSATHTYAEGGSYTISLTSRGGKITVPITAKKVAFVEGGSGTGTCVAPVFSTDEIPGGVVGGAWSLPLVSAPTASDLPQVSVSGQPASILLQNQIQVSAKTGSTTRAWILTGTPTTTGTYTVTLTAQNACGKASRTILLPIR